MSLLTTNLSRAPFRNRQPVVRLAILLWVLALGWTAWNGWSLWMGTRARQASREELANLNHEIGSFRERIETLETDLLRADLRAANRRTEFLNHRIAERAFSFNQLLGELGRTLPRGVRMVRLAPEVRREGSERVSRPLERIQLAFEGEAEDREQLLAWIDQLYSDPVFERPVLERESIERSGLVKFAGVVEFKASWSEAAADSGSEPTSGQPLAAVWAETGSKLDVAGIEASTTPGGAPREKRLTSARATTQSAQEPSGQDAAAVDPGTRFQGDDEVSDLRARGDESGAAPAQAPVQRSIFGVPMPLRRSASGE